jgi:predicted DNA-binding protein (UPF0251 family)
MTRRNETPGRLTSAIEATAKLWSQQFGEFRNESQTDALFVHTQIESLPVAQREARFYGRFIPLLQNVVTIFNNTYRRHFKLAVANPRECGPDPHKWAWTLLQAGIPFVYEWIQDWYVLACDGENRYVRQIASIPVVAGDTASISIPLVPPPPLESSLWRAPGWLFAVSPLVGIGLLKKKNVPDPNSDQRLTKAHTRLLLKGMRKVFRWKLRTDVEVIRNEETAAAGAMPIEIVDPQVRRSNIPPKHWLRGFEGLGPKASDLSQYTETLTEKQQMAFSLKYEFELGPAEVASRMGLDRKTVYEHLEAANRKIGQFRSSVKRQAKRSKNSSDL